MVPYHGFLWSEQGGWVLSPAYDLNPTPVDVKARILSIKIDLDDGTCSVELLQETAEYFVLGAGQSRTIILKVAEVTRNWRAVETEVRAKSKEITRMASAFEQEDLQAGLQLLRWQACTGRHLLKLRELSAKR